MAEKRRPTAPEASERVQRAKAVLDDYATMSIAACDRGEPWAAKVFFIEDEPHAGRFDMCCCMLLTTKKLANLKANQRIAFVVGGDAPDRWIQGVGTAEAVTDEADAEAVRKRLEEKAPAAGPFLSGTEWTAVRIHVHRMRLTDLASKPPVTEFTFA